MAVITPQRLRQDYCRMAYRSLKKVTVRDVGQAVEFVRALAYWFNRADPGRRHLTSERARPVHFRGCHVLELILNAEGDR
jgi:hypothetical protein